MRSPFPGMDPWLELHWGDVHHSLIQYSRDAIQGTLPDDLLARVEERVYVEMDDTRIRSIAPDSRISEWKSFPRRPLDSGTLHRDPLRQARLQFGVDPELRAGIDPDSGHDPSRPAYTSPSKPRT